jgi:hypothetical protein
VAFCPCILCRHGSTDILFQTHRPTLIENVNQGVLNASQQKVNGGGFSLVINSTKDSTNHWAKGKDSDNRVTELTKRKRPVLTVFEKCE